MSLSIVAAPCINAGAVCFQTSSPSFLGQKVSSNCAIASQRVSLRKRLSSRGVQCAVEDDVVLDTTTEDVDIYPSGEWPANFSLSNYEDLSHHYSPAIFRKEAQPGTILADIMNTTIRSAAPENTLSEVNHHFEFVTGLPVVGTDLTCVGVISRKDVAKSGSGLDGKVKDVMTTPAITISADKTVQEAAVNMLKAKVHRLPVVNESNQVVGIVTRTDIFTALEGLPSRD